MAGFSKLFSSIVTSSIWIEDDKTLRAWVAMLALSNAKGFVEGSLPGFASLCRMTLEEMQRCIEVLSSPDPYSRSPANEGRRIQIVAGGWIILNYEDYRQKGQDKSGSRAAYMREYRKDEKQLLHVTPRNTELLPVRTEAEAEADKDLNPLVGLSPDIGNLKAEKKSGLQNQAREILAFLNQKTGRRYQPVAANLNVIVSRMKEGATMTQLRQVVVRKTREWQGDDTMSPYLRPATLFNRTKFWQYAGELVPEGG